MRMIEKPIGLHEELAFMRAENIELRHQISELRARFSALQVVADSDTLTPLPNRRCFIREVERVIRHVGRYKSDAALLYLDVDCLKQINDRHGHIGGDAALIHIAYLIRNALRATDIVARIGGDEFGLLIDPSTEVAARTIIEKLDALMATTPFVVAGQNVDVTVSIGYTMIHPADTVEHVLARADSAMYAAKHVQRSAR